jgi:hypothetical protein
VIGDPLSVEREHGQLGRRTPNEAVQEHEIFGLARGQ